MFGALPVFNSGVRPRVELASSDGPTIAATYCLPPAEKLIGYPLAGDPTIASHNTAPVLSSSALNRPFESPPNTSPPPVATSDSMPARCSYFQSAWPVSAEIDQTVPTLSAPIENS